MYNAFLLYKGSQSFHLQHKAKSESTHANLYLQPLHQNQREEKRKGSSRQGDCWNTCTWSSCVCKLTFPQHEHAEFKSTNNQITQKLGWISRMPSFPKDLPSFPTLICIFSTTGAVQSWCSLHHLQNQLLTNGVSLQELTKIEKWQQMMQS